MLTDEKIEATPIRLTVHSGKQMGGTGWDVECGRITAHGSTLTEAKRNLADDITEALNSPDDEPSFARADDGALWVAIPDGIGGYHEWRVASVAENCGSCEGQAAYAFGRSVGMTIIHPKWGSRGEPT